MVKDRLDYETATGQPDLSLRRPHVDSYQNYKGPTIDVFGLCSLCN